MEIPEQKFIKVNVPPGVIAGSSLHVEIPGENRTLAAVVPPNVASFHVAYTPRLQGTQQQPLPPPSTTVPVPAVPAPAVTEPTQKTSAPPFAQALSNPAPMPPLNRLSHDRPPSRQSASPSPLPPIPTAPPAAAPQVDQSQKLILVRVPPGIKPGDTLHVSIPGEPGRLLAAKVPEGNLKEFHVAYKPNPSSKQAALATGRPPANGYNQYNANSNNRPYQQQQQPFSRNNGSNMLFPLLGGAALGAAGMAALGHGNHGGDTAAYDGGGEYVDSGMGDMDFDVGDMGGY